MEKKNKISIVLASNDLDKTMSALIIANGAKAMGMEAIIFFTFWGITVLRNNTKNSKNKSFLQKLMSIMLPNSSNKLPLSKMNMGGLGAKMMKVLMKKHNVASLQQLIDLAIEQKVRLVVCEMSMSLMGLSKEEIIDGVDYGGVCTYLDETSETCTNLFI
ncbi:DsrE/DsrF/DrsH-like family protein [Candidatus Margulisiibacteriota bacterium]